MKYKILPKEKISDPFSEGKFLWASRIEALRDIPRHRIKAGDLGGYMVAGPNRFYTVSQCLSQEGDSWIGGNAVVYKTWVSGNAIITDDAIVFGKIIPLTNNHLLEIMGDVNIYERAKVFFMGMPLKTVKFTGEAFIHGDSKIIDPTSTDSSFELTEKAILNGANIVLGDKSRIAGNSRINADCHIGYGNIIYDAVLLEGDRTADLAVVHSMYGKRIQTLIRDVIDYIEERNERFRTPRTDDELWHDRFLWDDMFGDHSSAEENAIRIIELIDPDILPEILEPNYDLLENFELDEVYDSEEEEEEWESPMMELESKIRESKARELELQMALEAKIKEQEEYSMESYNSYYDKFDELEDELDLISESNSHGNIFADYDSEVAEDNEDTIDFENSLKEIKDKVDAYQNDIVNVLKYPVMVDFTDDYTRALMDSLKKTSRIKPRKDPKGFILAVENLESVFMAAESNALRIAKTHLSEPQVKKIETADRLFALASNEAATINERSTAFKQGFKNLEGIIGVPAGTIERFKETTGLLEIEA